MLKKVPPGNHGAASPPDPLAQCPLNAAFVAVGGKWKLTLLYWLSQEPHQFAQLRRRAAPISQKVLTEQLRELEAHGLVEREPLGAAPAPVIYRLTEYGHTLEGVMEGIRSWGNDHLRRRGIRLEECGLACSTPVLSKTSVGPGIETSWGNA